MSFTVDLAFVLTSVNKFYSITTLGGFLKWKNIFRSLLNGLLLDFGNVLKFEIKIEAKICVFLCFNTLYGIFWNYVHESVSGVVIFGKLIIQIAALSTHLIINRLSINNWFNVNINFINS